MVPVGAKFPGQFIKIACSVKGIWGGGTLKTPSLGASLSVTKPPSDPVLPACLGMFTFLSSALYQRDWTKEVPLLCDTLGTLRRKFTFVSHPSDDLNVSTSDIGTSVRIRFKLRFFEDKVFEKPQECRPRCCKHYRDWKLRLWWSEVFLVIAGSQRVTDNCPRRAFLRSRTRGVALGE